MKPALKFGLILGIAQIILFAITFALQGNSLNYALGELVGYTTMILTLSVGIFLAQREARKSSNPPSLSFGKAFVNGITVSAISGLLFGIYTILLYTVLMPDLDQKMQEAYVNGMRESGASQEQIDAMVSQMENVPEFFHNPIFQGALMCITVILIGLFLSLIFSAIMMKKPPLSPQA